MRSLLIGIFFLLISLVGISQTKLKWKLGAMPELGLQIGSISPSGDARLNLLAEKKSWMLGLGGGIDFYRFQSYPIYVQARRVFTLGKWKSFAYSSVGYNIIGKVEQFSEWGNIWGRLASSTSYKYGGGLYAEAGAGLVARIKKKDRLYFSAGFVQKTVTEKYDSFYWLGIQNQVEPVTNTNVYTMNRLVMRVAFKF
jgi:hypothetical protein